MTDEPPRIGKEPNDPRIGSSEVVEWAPPFILPVDGWRSFEHLESCIRSYLRVRCQLTGVHIVRINLYANELLVLSPSCEPWIIKLPTERKTLVKLELIPGW